MKNPLFLARLSFALTLLAAPLSAHASGTDISLIFVSLVTAFWPVWVIAGVLVLVVAGFTLVTANDEGKLEKARSTIIAVVIGGIVTTIIYFLGTLGFVGIMYNGFSGILLISNNQISIEAVGIAEWLMVISVMLGMVFIIIAALRAVSSLGDEGKYENARNAVLQAVIGFIVIAASYTFKIVFFEARTPSALIAIMAGKILIVLTVILIIAVGVLIYAGFRMIISFGDESQYEAAKQLAIRVAVGILIILLSFALVIIIAKLF